MKIQFDQYIDQKQIIAPRMLRSLDILQMGNAELIDYLKNYSLENPVVEIIEPVVVKTKSYSHTLDDSYDDYINNIPESTDDLLDDLLLQTKTLDISDEISQELILLIQSLDDSGYLPADTALYEEQRCGKIFRKALSILWSLEPTGIGARNIQECLILQLRKIPNSRFAIQIVTDHLPKVANHDYDSIQKNINCSSENIEEAIKMILSCNPKPANGFHNKEKTVLAIPDIIVNITKNRIIQVALNENTQPSLRVNPKYRMQLFPNVEDKAAKYISEKIYHAEMIISFLDKRSQTLLQCAKIMVQKQSAFFLLGKDHLLPLSLQDVAEEMNVAISTVSRAIRDKYIKCNYGIIPIKSLFMRSSEVYPSEGKIKNVLQIKQIIKELIQQEDKSKPLNDSAIANILHERGIHIAKRTVSKYRDELGIFPVAIRRVG